MKGFRDAAKICGVYIGVIVGAGFASGQEVLRFFVQYGGDWIWGMVLAGVLFALAGWSVLRLIRERGLQTYGDFCNLVLGRTLGRVMEWICGFFLFALFCTMTAAAGAAVQEILGWSRWVGVAALLGVCSWVFARGVEGMVVVNDILSPLLLLGGAVLSLAALRNSSPIRDTAASLPVFSFVGAVWRTSRTWVFSAIIYVSYNMVTTVSVLLPLRAYLSDRRTPRRVGLVSGLAMALLGSGLGAALYRSNHLLAGQQLPLLAVLGTGSALLTGLYAAFFGAAVLTTAVGNAFGALQFFRERFPRHRRWWPAFLILGAAGASCLDFSQWVAWIYPLFGYLGLLELAVLLFSLLKS